MQNLPSPYECHQLTAFCEAFWGVQFGSTVDDENPLELFKFISLYGFLVLHSIGSPAWKSIGQNHTALRSWEADIMATN